MAAKRTAGRKATRRRTPGKEPADAQQKHDIDKGVEQFAEEVGKLGERIGKRCENGGRGLEAWFHSTFGVIGPLLSSVAGLMLLVLLIWALSLLNIHVGSGLLYNIYYFFLAHIGWFFLIFVFFSYSSYISKKWKHAYFLVSPVFSAAGITIAVWVLANVIRIANMPLGVDALSSLASFLDSSLFTFFYLFAFLGYLFVAAKVLTGRWDGMKGLHDHGRSPPEKKDMKARKPLPAKTDRLYRSGRDRILGGVCGGIAEYLGVDPVLIRLLWIIGTLAWGFGILLYIIMWIIMPRNPDHEWK